VLSGVGARVGVGVGGASEVESLSVIGEAVQLASTMQIKDKLSRKVLIEIRPGVD
jgi:hypothetical protein